ncbi:DUF2218 domain-containing protein [Parasphingorhabdus flavimaris]|uniref:DUF2218 domain-containing protein n=1 Tax=Parasphingorhabdus flavimaris TaxID=266812 RepID=A0ABX2N1T0_9SPHN|nr:DUF2218 domain-containing protein [Parasphingorhabdus flavimaris]
MKYIAEAQVPTDNAKKYAAQLGKHWAHNLAVEERGEAVLITFPKDARGAAWPADAVVTLAPEGGTLRCCIEASSEGQRDGLKGAVERHVDRFAFREAPLNYKWRDSED